MSREVSIAVKALGDVLRERAAGAQQITMPPHSINIPPAQVVNKVETPKVEVINRIAGHTIEVSPTPIEVTCDMTPVAEAIGRLESAVVKCLEVMAAAVKVMSEIKPVVEVKLPAMAPVINLPKSTINLPEMAPVIQVAAPPRVAMRIETGKDGSRRIIPEG